jgi:hypothetical protein
VILCLPENIASNIDPGYLVKVERSYIEKDIWFVSSEICCGEEENNEGEEWKNKMKGIRIISLTTNKLQERRGERGEERVCVRE